jgi:hypothetical protein
MVQGEGLEFKPQYHKKQEKQKQTKKKKRLQIIRAAVCLGPFYTVHIGITPTQGN